MKLLIQLKKIKEKIKSNDEIKDISIDVDANIDKLKKAVGDLNKLLEKKKDFDKMSEKQNDQKK